MSEINEREAFEKWLGVKPCGAAHDFGWAAWKARAALAVTQAQDVVLPEPAGYLVTKLEAPIVGSELKINRSIYTKNEPTGKHQKLYTEQQVRAMLATGGQGEVDLWWRKRSDEIELQVARTGSKEAMRCFTEMRTLLQAAAAPRQADARDALTPAKPVQPKGMTSINARLSFNLGWVACERHHGIRSEDVEQAVATDAAAAAKEGKQHG